MNSTELDALEQHGLVKRIIGELVGDANTEVQVSGDGIDPAQIRDELEQLDAQAVFGRAAYLARQHGGAMVWMVTDKGDQADLLSTPMRAHEQVQRLVVMSRWELSPSGKLETDRTSREVGRPLEYVYSPQDGGGTYKIHHSRLIRFSGDPVPELLLSQYHYFGAPVMEGCIDEFERLMMASSGGAELTHTFGTLAIQLDNLDAMLEKKDGTHKLQKWFEVQLSAFSMLRAWVLGKGQALTVNSPTLSGWTDIYDRLAQLLATVVKMPITKLYGQAPGGLSTDDASAWRNWSARVRKFQSSELRPAYRRLLDVMFASRSAAPGHYKIEFEPYDIPGPKEQAEVAKLRVESLAAMFDRGALDVDEFRANLEVLPGVVLIEDELEDDSDANGLAEAPPAAPGVDVQKSVLNGAQIASLVDVVARVVAGEIPKNAAAEILVFSLQVPRDVAESMVDVDVRQELAA